MKKSFYVKLVVAVFFLIVCADILGIILGEMTVRFIFKPLITISLMLLYVMSVSKINPFYIAAMVFAFAADTLLLNNADEYFIFALGSFLLMYLSYLIIITKDIFIYQAKKLSIISIPFIIVLVMVVFFASSDIDKFLYPIIVYGSVVCLFSGLSFYNYLERKSDVSLLIFLGSFLFIISNSMCALEKFRLQNKDLAVGIMFTYAIAQFLICMHMIGKAKGAQTSEP